MNNPLSRENIRQHIRITRNSLSSAQQLNSALNITQRLITLKKVQQAKHIAISLAFDGELNTQPFIQWCWENNKNIYLPVIHPTQQRQLLFLHYTRTTKIILNQYGIKEPTLEAQNIYPLAQLDLIFTPLVAFDKQGNRLGMGGGYYDSILTPWFEQRTGPYPIGLAHDCQLVEQLPIESWDIPLPEIITPAKHYQFITK